jgi:hypothetical protein
LIVGLALLALKAWQVVSTVRSLQSRLAQAQAMAQSANRNLELDRVDSLLMGARADVRSLRSEAGPFLSLAPHLGWLPGFGGDLQAAPALLDIADSLIEAGVIVWDQVSPLVEWWSAPDRARGVDLQYATLAQLAAARPQIEQARAALNRAADARARLRAERLSPRLAGQVRKLDDLLPLARLGVEALLGAPKVLGLNEPRTYLVLAQNEDELRPAGGFITGVGEVRIEAGRLASMSFRDSYSVDDFSQPYPDPPEPLLRYMNTDLWVFRDSNWSPDFPTAARQAIALYRPAYPVSIDGVIAVDQQALQGFVGALGQLTVPGEDQPITGDMVMTYIRRSWAPEDASISGDWWIKRKSFMGPLAEAAWKRIESGQVDWSVLVETLVRLLDEKHLLVYLPDSDIAGALAQQGWDGAVRPGSGDFLMVTDANLGFNKASAKVQVTLAHQVDLSQSPFRSQLELVYTHASEVNTPCRQQAHYSPTYEQMMDRCYWDYLQVYVPQGSQLLGATRIPIPGTELLSGKDEPGEVTVQQAEGASWLSMGLMSVLAPSVTQSRFITWTLPAGVVRWQGNEGWYTLRVQKQPGTRGHPLAIQIRFPTGGSLLDATPGAQVLADHWVAYQTTLDRDCVFQLHWKR